MSLKFPIAGFLILIPVFIHCQQPWNRVINLPQENTINDLMRIPGTNKVVAVGEGSTVMYSENLGQNWEIKCNPAGLNNYSNLISVDFLNVHLGFIGTSDGKIIKTLDGGNLWFQVYSGVPTVKFNDFYFFDENSGFACGDFGWLLQTTNGGLNWDQVTVPLNSSFMSIQFVTSTRGYIFAESISYFLETTNAGVTWNLKEFPNLNVNSLHDLQFVNDTTCYLLGVKYTSQGDIARVFKSYDSGNTWNQIFEDNVGAQKLSFADENRGYILYHQWWSPGGIWLTTDGGNTWEMASTPNPRYLINVSRFYDDNTAFIAGYNGTLARTDNAGQTWTPLFEKPIPGNVKRVQVLNADSGFCLNADHFGGSGVASDQLRKTADGGTSWEPLKSFTYPYTAFYFLSSQLGFAATTYPTQWGTFCKTTDGGLSWSEWDFPPNVQVVDMQFLDEMRGVVIGDHNIVMTTDGGLTWNQVFSGPEGNKIVRCFSPTNIGVVNRNKYITTTDGGQTWMQYTIHNDVWPVTDAAFLDNGMIFACSYNKIFKSVDGGLMWLVCTLNNQHPIEFRSISFPSDNIGYAAGDGPFETMMKTTDAGQTWHVLDSPASSAINVLYFPDELHGFAFGNEGLILETFTGGLVGLVQPEDKKFYQGCFVFPNPFTSTLTVDIGLQAVQSSAIVEICNLMGQTVISFEVRGKDFPYSFSTEMLGPGLYVLKLQFGGSEIFVMKIIRL